VVPAWAAPTVLIATMVSSARSIAARARSAKTSRWIWALPASADSARESRTKTAALVVWTMRAPVSTRVAPWSGRAAIPARRRRLARAVSHPSIATTTTNARATSVARAPALARRFSAARPALSATATVFAALKLASPSRARQIQIATIARPAAAKSVAPAFATTPRTTASARTAVMPVGPTSVRWAPAAGRSTSPPRSSSFRTDTSTRATWTGSRCPRPTGRSSFRTTTSPPCSRTPKSSSRGSGAARAPVTRTHSRKPSRYRLERFDSNCRSTTRSGPRSFPTTRIASMSACFPRT
jgi:hypothetical protein